MADRFVDYSEDTPVCAAWLNQVDRSVYNALGSSDTPAQLRTFLGVLGEAPVDGNVYGRQNGGWAVVEIDGSPVGDAILRAPTSATLNTITQAAATYYPLRIKTHASVDPSFHILEVLDASDGVQAFINANGSFVSGEGYLQADTTPAPGSSLSGSGYIVAVGPTDRATNGYSSALINACPSTGTIGLAVKADTGNTADLFRAVSPTSATLASISADGFVYSGNAAGATGVAGLLGGASARLSAVKPATTAIEMLKLQAATSGATRELLFYDKKPGSIHPVFGGDDDAVLQIRNKFTGTGEELDLVTVQLRSNIGGSGCSGKLTMGYGVKSDNASRRYWHQIYGVNVADPQVWFGHSSNMNDSGDGQLSSFRIHSSGDIYAARDVYANNVKLTSDETLKERIEPAPRFLDKIMRLQPITFSWLGDATRHTGFSAQATKEVLPEIVGEASGGYLTIETTTLVPMLVSAVQELTQRLEAVEVA